jgi:hypothetical protein
MLACRSSREAEARLSTFHFGARDERRREIPTLREAKDGAPGKSNVKAWATRHPRQRTLRLSGAMLSCARRSTRSANDRKHQGLGHPAVYFSFKSNVEISGTKIANINR